MSTRVNVFLAAATLVALVPAAAFALSPYSEDFESMAQSDPNALANGGWLVYGNVFDAAMNYLYGYGVYPAPNGTPGFCSVAVGEGGAAQGAQQIVIYNDYNNADHAKGYWIEALVFQEQLIGPGDVGETWEFSFQAKRGDLEAPSTAAAFVKTLNPAAGYQTTNYIPLDMTSTPGTWRDYAISLTIDGTLDGQLLQFGFLTLATNYVPSGVFYDNIQFDITGSVVAGEPATWGEVKALFR